MIKKLLVLALCSALTACGGSSDDSPSVDNGQTPGTGTGTGGNTGDSGNTPSPTFTVRTVSHLQDAQVCADANADMICQEDEVLGETDEDGYFEVSEDFQDINLIVNTFINQTYDLQAESGVGSPYSLYASAPVTYITPITTLIEKTSTSYTELAALWQIDEDVLRGDYAEGVSGGKPTLSVITLAISTLIQNELKAGSDLNLLAGKVSDAMVDVVEAMDAGTSLDNLVFIMNSEGNVVTNIEKALMEYVDFDKLSGNWNYYHFAGVDSDTYGTATVKDSALNDAFCLNSEELNSESVFSSDSSQECTFMSFNADGNVIIGGVNSLKLVYGHTSDVGTVVLFKVTTAQGSGQIEDGYMWFDNMNSNPAQGMSLMSWDGMVLHNIGQDSRGETAMYTLVLNSGELTFTYANDVEYSATYEVLASKSYANGLNITGDSLEYQNIDTGATDLYTAMRVGKYVALGLVEHDSNKSFTILSGNEDLVQSVNDGELVGGTVMRWGQF